MRTVQSVLGDESAALGALLLGSRERAVLAVLARRSGRVVDRAELRQVAGLAELSPRRCDALIVGLRRAIGPDAIVTVRRRGWMLRPDAAAVVAAIVSNAAS
jgi:DNA-binding response OmpR family regulator